MNPIELEQKEKIESFDFSLDAPCDSMYNKWTDEAKERVKIALSEIFEWS
mgnify:CR=1 FL=1